MSKFNRDIDLSKMEASKERIIKSVTLKMRQQRKPIISNIQIGFVFAMLVAALLIPNIIPSNNDNNTNPGTFNQNTADHFAEIGYLSGNLISTSYTATRSGLRFMDTTPVSSFEDNLVEIKVYFNTLKAYLDGNELQNTYTISYDDPSYDIVMTFTTDGVDFVYQLNQDGSDLSGILMINSINYSVTGHYVEDQNYTSLELTASNGANYVTIEYSSELEDEIQTTYEVKSSINGVYTEKEIKIKFENDEYEVEIEEANKEYELTKYIEGGVTYYYLEYKINESEGEVIITETINELNQTVYVFNVTEDGNEFEVESSKPDHEDHDETEDDSNSLTPTYQSQII